jgi:glycosyltransferase involved in cell wall biosynthesis
VRVALLKPDYGSIGGFERLLGDVHAGLLRRGLAVDVVTFDATSRGGRCFGIRVPEGVRSQHPEYFQYLEAVERLDALDLSAHDVVVASQPPSFLARHDRVVAVFYHQARRFYDLAETAVESELVHPDVHHAAVEEVRRLDRSRIGGVRTWLAGSREVAGRLRDHWGVEESVRPFRAAPAAPTTAPPPYDPSGPAICVSRHTWTKRTELVVQAAHLDGSGGYELIGGGDRMAWVRHLDAELARHPDAARTEDPGRSWRNPGLVPRLRRPPTTGAANLVLHGPLDDRGRDAAYGRAGVVVAPAFREDYGLTVLEAFDRERPVIVCRDGGGLVELVEGTGAGLVVEPTGAAVAEGVRRLRQDPEQARAMAGAAARQAGSRGREEALDALVEAIEGAAAG